MPIKIPEGLPAKQVLENENIFVMTENRAVKQDIRPLKIAVLNLMPTKIITETQLTRLLSNSPLQVEITLLQTASHAPKHTSAEHMEAFYKCFLGNIASHHVESPLSHFWNHAICAATHLLRRL